MAEHRLKTWPEYFGPVALGLKNFELRFNDRDYHVGDILVLEEYDPDSKSYTGESLKVEVTYILKNSHSALGDGWAILSIRRLT